jgi:hypothetical protein
MVMVAAVPVRSAWDVIGALYGGTLNRNTVVDRIKKIVLREYSSPGRMARYHLSDDTCISTNVQTHEGTAIGKWDRPVTIAAS